MGTSRYNFYFCDKGHRGSSVPMWKVMCIYHTYHSTQRQNTIPRLTPLHLGSIDGLDSIFTLDRKADFKRPRVMLKSVFSFINHRLFSLSYDIFLKNNAFIFKL